VQVQEPKMLSAPAFWVGMVSATVLVVIFAPLFYVLIEKIFGKKGRRESIETGGANVSGGK